MDQWDLAPGDELTRAERRRRFGGAEYGGIEPSRASQAVFVYTDPDVGAAHGYDYDGWVDNETIFQYTGQGRRGDQTLTDRNKTLLEHQQRGLVVRLFAANGTVAGPSNTKRQTYLGEFTIDSKTAYSRAEAIDDNDDVRTVLVFRLLPDGKVLRRRQDRCTGNALSASATIEHIDDHGTEVGDIKVEAQRSTSFERRPLESATGERREAELVNQYKEFRRDQGHAVRNRSIRLPGQSHPLRTDLYDETTNDLCEAKSSASRRDIRYALGQILDYGRHVPHDTLSVLVPVEPTPDLVRLLHASDVACVFKGRDSFIRLDPD